MTSPVSRTVLQEQLPALFEVRSHDEGVDHVSTPFRLPDGTMVDVYVDAAGPQLIVTDFGDTSGWLWLLTGGRDLTGAEQDLIAEAASVPGVKLERGSLVAEPECDEDVAKRIIDVAQAAVRMGSLLYAFRPPPDRSFRKEVQALLQNRGFKIESAPEYRGRSGETWRASFIETSPRGVSLLFLLTGATALQASAAADHMLRACGDLPAAGMDGGGFAGVIAILDDVDGEWADKIVERLAAGAKIVRRTELSRLLDALGPAVASPVEARAD